MFLSILICIENISVKFIYLQTFLKIKNCLNERQSIIELNLKIVLSVRV